MPTSMHALLPQVWHNLAIYIPDDATHALRLAGSKVTWKSLVVLVSFQHHSFPLLCRPSGRIVRQTLESSTHGIHPFPKRLTLTHHVVQSLILFALSDKLSHAWFSQLLVCSTKILFSPTKSVAPLLKVRIQSESCRCRESITSRGDERACK